MGSIEQILRLPSLLSISGVATQAWLQFQGDEPPTLHLGTFIHLGSRVTTANVAFDDHPNAKRPSKRIDTITVDSMFAWTQHSGLSVAPQTIR